MVHVGLCDVADGTRGATPNTGNVSSDRERMCCQSWQRVRETKRRTRVDRESKDSPKVVSRTMAYRAPITINHVSMGVIVEVNKGPTYIQSPALKLSLGFGGLVEML